jgi:hypothetical protein
MGPVERAELEKLFESGTVAQNTMVLQEGMMDWIPYQDLKKTTQFITTFRPKTPPPEPKS